MKPKIAAVQRGAIINPHTGKPITPSSQMPEEIRDKARHIFWQAWLRDIPVGTRVSIGGHMFEIVKEQRFSDGIFLQWICPGKKREKAFLSRVNAGLEPLRKEAQEGENE